MRKRGESAAGWDDDPDAELRWAATDRLAEAVCQAVRKRSWARPLFLKRGV